LGVATTPLPPAAPTTIESVSPLVTGSVALTVPAAPPTFAPSAELPPDPPATVTTIEATPFGIVQYCGDPVSTKVAVHSPPVQFVPGTSAAAGASGENSHVAPVTVAMESNSAPNLAILSRP
jgi:hypothetical protein